MLVIRLRRIGKKGKPTYRLVVAEHTFPVSGQYVADLGHYNPHTKTIGLKKDETTEWLNKGAKPSNTVARLLEREKVKHSSVVVVKKNKKPRLKDEEKKAPAAAPAAAETSTTPAEDNAETPESPAEETPSEVTKSEEAPGSEPGKSMDATESVESNKPEPAEELTDKPA